MGLISFQNEQAIHTLDRLISKDEIKAVFIAVKEGWMKAVVINLDGLGIVLAGNL